MCPLPQTYIIDANCSVGGGVGRGPPGFANRPFTTGFCKLTRTTGFCKMSKTTGFCNLSGRGPPGFAIFPLTFNRADIRRNRRHQGARAVMSWLGAVGPASSLRRSSRSSYSYCSREPLPTDGWPALALEHQPPKGAECSVAITSLKPSPACQSWKSQHLRRG